MNKDSKVKKTRLRDKLVSGAIAGIIGTSIIFPIDLVKTRLQNDTQKRSGIKIFRHILNTEGTRDSLFNLFIFDDLMPGLYRGLLPNLIGVTPEKAIKLAVNDALREHFAHLYNLEDVHDLPTSIGMFCGGIILNGVNTEFEFLSSSGFCQVVATNPMEMVKIHLQMHGSKTTMSDLVRNMGFKGLYKGSLATLCRDVPFSLIFFETAASFRSYFSSGKKASETVVFGSGILAGIIAAGVVTPMDVVKTRLQLESHKDVKDHVYHNIKGCYTKIYREEGIRAFFKGAIQRCCVVAPLFGISLLVYEFQKKLFHN